MLISDLIDRDRVAALALRGVLVLDVDDTLLARRGGSADKGETYRDSEAAQLLPKLLGHGLRIALTTGHGAHQLGARLLEPLVADLTELPRSSIQHPPLVYANRGGTRIDFANGCFVSSASYGAAFRIVDVNHSALTAILEKIAPPDHVNPAKVELRDEVVLSLRPIAKELRPEAIQRARRLMKAAGLSDAFDVQPAGKTTIEISAHGLTKSIACEDALSSASNLIGLSIDKVEAASIMIGDEFTEGGNDRPVALDFPAMTCVSVAPRTPGNQPHNVAQFSDFSGVCSTTRTAAAVLREILKVLDKLRQSGNLKGTS